MGTPPRADIVAVHPETPRNRVYTKSAAEVATRALAFEEQVASGSLPALTWGIPVVDATVRTMWAGKLIYLVGLPSHGKSMSLVHLARRECWRVQAMRDEEKRGGVVDGAASKAYVLFTSLEDPEHEVHASITGAPATQIEVMERRHDREAYRRHLLYSALGWPIYYQGYDEAEVSAGMLEDLPNLTVEQAYREIRQLEADHGMLPTAWFVDYLQLFASELRERTESEERIRIANVSKQLKRIARTLGIPVVCAAQAKQTVDTRSIPIPTDSDILGSNQPRQDADVLMSVWMPARQGAGRWVDGLEVDGLTYPPEAITPGFTVLSLFKQRGFHGFGRWAIEADVREKSYHSVPVPAQGWHS
ncbi:DnaB-like helicase C-terminal domain-containing protein [uncultured Piscinibacter sp.]|uniref:DnaB-like helicase C-terminal domain-containing protein n=1 Tax=uncultured Piscinibacter sp. TaxID=1131835 RepID=UPI002616D2B3|nr:DnaB-like helicase C-terminal domain-containing protein [uncultured Piscinibacter sp.]